MLIINRFFKKSQVPSFTQSKKEFGPANYKKMSASDDQLFVSSYQEGIKAI